ncbi:Conserved_hypothetical protein [Hexamita inflata]|uniref:HNH nuclease domain-containing protein n=1 Tax=Hexamita inflata TaxID=28002 RepID=A0AA86NZ94_9EUKA|nr:Conserved hypothetical protein [Hexamita inflata]
MSDSEDYSQSDSQIEEYEDFYPIEGYDNYEISKNGIVRNKNTKKIIKQYREKKGYLRLNIFDDKQNKYIKQLTHRLLAQTFIPNPNNLPLIDHINRDKQDNRIQNLRWVSNRDNTRNIKQYNKHVFQYFINLPDEENCIEFQCYNGYQFGHYFINTETLDMYYDTDYQFKKISLQINNTYILFDINNNRRPIYLVKLQRGEYN